MGKRCRSLGSLESRFSSRIVSRFRTSTLYSWKSISDDFGNNSSNPWPFFEAISQFLNGANGIIICCESLFRCHFKIISDQFGIHPNALIHVVLMLMHLGASLQRAAASSRNCVMMDSPTASGNPSSVHSAAPVLPSTAPRSTRCRTISTGSKRLKRS